MHVERARDVAMATLSDYERHRLENIASNNARLEALGLHDAAAALKKPKATLSDEEKRRREASRAKRLAEATASRRVSPRMEEAEAKREADAVRAQRSRASAEQASSAVESIAAEIALLVAARPRGKRAAADSAVVKKLKVELRRAQEIARLADATRKADQRSVEGASRRGFDFVVDDEDDDEPRRRRPSKVKRAAKAAAALSAEEREVLAGAEGWLEEMAAFFTNKLSPDNLRNVMKVVSALASGSGVAHPKKANTFKKSSPVTLAMDLVALKDEANRFLRPEDDSGHGWRLNHPIGKLIIFQAHLHAQHKATKATKAAKAPSGAPATPRKPKAALRAAATEAPPTKRARRAV